MKTRIYLEDALNALKAIKIGLREIDSRLSTASEHEQMQDMMVVIDDWAEKLQNDSFNPDLWSLPMTEPAYQWMPDACRACSNHPQNGGSGICHCTLGQFPIT